MKKQKPPLEIKSLAQIKMSATYEYLDGEVWKPIYNFVFAEYYFNTGNKVRLINP